MAKDDKKPNYQEVLGLLAKGYSDEKLTSELRKLGYSGTVKRSFTVNEGFARRTFTMKYKGK